jgi:hypothetical protein
MKRIGLRGSITAALTCLLYAACSSGNSKLKKYHYFYRAAKTATIVPGAATKKYTHEKNFNRNGIGIVHDIWR